MSFVKDRIDQLKTVEEISKGEKVKNGAICVIACSAALEAFVNRIYLNYVDFAPYDELRLASKIDTIGILKHKPIEWGHQPWQDISKMLKLRNWVVHYKAEYLGLANTEMEWISDEINQPPKMDPFLEFSIKNVEKIYKSNLNAIRELYEKLDTSLVGEDFFETEDYLFFELC